MSQKPRTGAPIKPTLPTRAPINAASVESSPVPTEPDDPPDDPVEPTATVDRTLNTAPLDKVESVAEPPPLAEPRLSIQVAGTEPMADAAPVPAAIPEPITATGDTIPAVTAEAVDFATARQPTKPTPTISQGMKTMMKSTEDFVAFGQANLEAFMKSGQIWSAGVQELTKQFATTAKASFEESVSTFKAISTAKSVKEAMELQTTFAKAALEKAMAESNKLTDASIKLTEQTLAPITARVTVAVETFGKAA